MGEEVAGTATQKAEARRDDADNFRAPRRTGSARLAIPAVRVMVVMMMVVVIVTVVVVVVTMAIVAVVVVSLTDVTRSIDVCDRPLNHGLHLFDLKNGRQSYPNGSSLRFTDGGLGSPFDGGRCSGSAYRSYCLSTGLFGCGRSRSACGTGGFGTGLSGCGRSRSACGTGGFGTGLSSRRAHHDIIVGSGRKAGREEERCD